MCFASSIVEAHKKLFIAPTTSAAGAAESGEATNAKDKKLAKMSRSRSRLQQTEVCGDCGATDPAWASINRGILLCSDCCSVHRSLGRHISMVKSLRQGTWEPSVLNFVNSLNAHGANSVWEHHLLDGTHQANNKSAARIKKPSPKDPVHPNKADFINAKHLQLSFVLRPSLQEEENAAGVNLEHELSKQLHASVRTSNLETSLRLIVQGADPNYFHEEKRSSPLHVAAKFGQASQIELLLVYGADINAVDGNGQLAIEIARANNHTTVAERLLDAMYEVTDRMIMFLGGKKPDHKSGIHLVVPNENQSNDISEELKIARGRLQLVPNKMFEELVMDLYDEIDRRENEAIWATSNLNAESSAVPFLPVNPFLSATRNQGRQKLARFTRAEFAGLLTDVLIDARRRENLAKLRMNTDALGTGSAFSGANVETGAATNAAGTSKTSSYQNTASMSFNTSEHDPDLSDDEPIYDPVASDDDYAPVPPFTQRAIVHHSATPDVTSQETNAELESLRRQISEYALEINQLKTVVQQLSTENAQLKEKLARRPPPIQPRPQSAVAAANSVASINSKNATASTATTAIASMSSASVYNEPLRIDLNGSENDNEPHSLPAGIGACGIDATAAAGSSSSSATSSATNSNQSTIRRPVSMYERRLGGPILFNKPVNNEQRVATSLYQMSAAEKSAATEAEVRNYTELVTRRLRELVAAVPDASSMEALVPCAERVRVAVVGLINVFTMPSTYSENIRETLQQLARYNKLIQHECENLRNAYYSEDKYATVKYMNEVRECAYHIASSIKTLYTQFDAN